MIVVPVEAKIYIFKVFYMDFLLPIASSFKQYMRYVSYNPFI